MSEDQQKPRQATDQPREGEQPVLSSASLRSNDEPERPQPQPQYDSFMRIIRR